MTRTIAAILALGLSVLAAPGATAQIPQAFLSIGPTPDQHIFDETFWSMGGGLYGLDFALEGDGYRVSGDVGAHADGFAAYGLSIENHSDFARTIVFGFTTPIDALPASTIYGSMAASLTDLEGDGWSVASAAPADYDGDGVLELQHAFVGGGAAGLDLGDGFFEGSSGQPGRSVVFGPFESGPVDGPDGTFETLGMTLWFELSPNDIFTVNGYTGLGAPPVPEPSAVLLLGLGLAGIGLGLFGRRR